MFNITVSLFWLNLINFRLKHFAGTVTYNINGFVEKNLDYVPKDLSHAMYNCAHPLLKSLFPEGTNLSKI